MTVWSHLPTIFNQRRVLRIAGIITLCVALTTTLFFGFVSHAAPGINKTLNFQARLQRPSGGIIPDGHYNIQFKIYQDGAGTSTGNPGGSLKWTENYVNNNGTSGVEVKNGYLSVALGSVTPFGTSVDWNQDTLWLSMNIAGSATDCTTFGSGSCTADGEMLPMQRLTATPYALNAGQLGGKAADNFVQLAQGVQTDASTNTSSVFINKTGSGNLVQLQNTGSDVFTVDNTGNVTLGSSASKTISIGQSGADTAGQQLSVAAGAGGTGTGAAGGNLLIQGGAAGGTNGNGGNVQIDSGAKTGTGTEGSISIGTSRASAITIGKTGVATTVQGSLSVTQSSSLNDVTVAAGKSLTLTGGNTASRPSSPTEGMLYFDTTTHQLLMYGNGRWRSQPREASRIVAPSGASQAAKDGADYVADGTSDQVEINQALTDVSSAGGKVYLLDGTFNTDDVISMPNNTTLAGAGRSTLIKFANINNQSKNMITNSDTSTGTGVAIRDLRLDGNKTVNTTGTQRGIYFSAMGGGTGSSARQGAFVTNVTATSFRSENIFITNSSNNRFTNLVVQDSAADGMQVGTSSANNTVSDSKFQGNTGNGFLANGGSTGNNISGNHAQGNGVGGFNFSNSSNNTLSSNTATGNSAYGFNISTSATGNSVTGNTAQGNTNGGFNIAGTGNTFSGNSINGGTNGINVNSGATNNTISGNTVQSATQGIVVSANDTTVNGNTVITSTQQGILLSSANNVIVSFNKISNSGAATTNNGIQVVSSDDNTISNNVISDTSATTNNYAISITTSASDRNYLTGNQLGTGTINDVGTSTVYGGQTDSSSNYNVQPAGDIKLMKNTAVTGNLSVSGSTTIEGDLKVSDGSSNYATIDVSALSGDYTISIPTVTANDSFCLQSLGNCTTSSSATGYTAPSFDTAAPGTLSLGGTNATTITIGNNNSNVTINGQSLTVVPNTSFTGTVTFNDDVTLAAGQALTITGGTTGTRPGSPAAGTLYYDTTLGKLQCYEADGWGACGAAPDTFITISPEYTNAVMNGNDIGTITSDICSDTLNLNDGSSSQPTICGTNETYNFYKWTSAESTSQTRSIYVTYQLPSNFKEFVPGSTSLMGRTDSSDASVNYQVYKDHNGGALAACGSAVSVSTGAQSAWQEGAAAGTSDPANCSFAAGDSVFIRINLSAKSSANAYVSNINFTYSNN